MQILDVLKKLTDVCGVSGDEFPASETAAELIKPYAESVGTDDMGNVVAVIKKPKDGEKTILLDAHIDRIGLIVTQICDGGFLRVDKCGGVDVKALAAQSVRVHAQKPLYGVVTAMPPHLQSAKDMEKAFTLDELFVDLGMSKEQAEKTVRPGDRVTALYESAELPNGRFTASAVDDRAGVASLIAAAEIISKSDTGCGVTALFSAQEETGERGAAAASVRIDYDEVIAVDVSFAFTPDSQKHKCGVMGKGAMIGVSSTLTKEISDDFVTLAKNAGIDYQLEIMAGETGTNADRLGISALGARSGLLSIPIKYMHMPCETVQISDIESVSRLLAEYVLKKGGAQNV